MSFDKQNLTLVVISNEIYETRRRLVFINFIWNDHSCKILYMNGYGYGHAYDTMGLYVRPTTHSIRLLFILGSIMLQSPLFYLFIVSTTVSIQEQMRNVSVRKRIVNIQEGFALIYRLCLRITKTVLLKIFAQVLVVLHTTNSFHYFAVIS